MNDHPTILDEHRGMAAQQATEIRRRLAAVAADQTALRQRRTELEKFLLAAPAVTWADAAEKARYPITLFATTALGQDPRRQKLIASVLDDFARLSQRPTEPIAPPGEPQTDGGDHAEATRRHPSADDGPGGGDLTAARAAISPMWGRSPP